MNVQPSASNNVSFTGNFRIGKKKENQETLACHLADSKLITPEERKQVVEKLTNMTETLNNATPDYATGYVTFNSGKSHSGGYFADIEIYLDGINGEKDVYAGGGESTSDKKYFMQNVDDTINKAFAAAKRNYYNPLYKKPIERNIECANLLNMLS